MSQSRTCLTGSDDSQGRRRGMALPARFLNVRAGHRPCDWEMSAEKYGTCSKCGAEWSNWQKPAVCAER